MTHDKKPLAPAITLASAEVAKPRPSSAVATPAAVAKAADARSFLVRCVDPALFGYVVRGVRIPQGGEALVHVKGARNIADVLADKAITVKDA